MTVLNQVDLEKAYEYFDVTADIGFYAYGRTLNEAYENAGLAMFNLITNTQKVKQKVSKRIEIISEDLVSLLYDYLEELLFLQDTEFLFFSRFDVEIKKIENNNENSLNIADDGDEFSSKLNIVDDGDEFSFNDLDSSLSLSNYKLICQAYGEEINWEIHDRGSEVKAITFHLMEVSEEDGIFKLRAILDL